MFVSDIELPRRKHIIFAAPDMRNVYRLGIILNGILEIDRSDQFPRHGRNRRCNLLSQSETDTKIFTQIHILAEYHVIEPGFLGEFPHHLQT